MPNTGSTITSHSEARATAAEPESVCCGGPAPVGANACCARDAMAKSAGGAGCGCTSGSSPTEPARPRSGCCS